MEGKGKVPKTKSLLPHAKCSGATNIDRGDNPRMRDPAFWEQKDAGNCPPISDNGKIAISSGVRSGEANRFRHALPLYFALLIQLRVQNEAAR